MALEVVAQSPADFERWRVQQLQPAAPPQTDAQKRGLQMVEYRCGLCHQVRGTTAAAVTRPRPDPSCESADARRRDAAQHPGALSGWIENAQGIKPGSLMPNQGLSGTQLGDVVAYLESLQ